MSRGTELYLEVEDAGIVVSETLFRGHHSVQESGVQREGGGGSKKPTVTLEERRLRPRERRG